MLRNQTPNKSLISLVETLLKMNAESRESSNERIEWTWDLPEANEFVNLLNDNKDVKFHKNFSSGTAVIRGSLPMSCHQYFWELKMISPVYGTDMMIGVGTTEADVSQVHDKFISLLGNDQHSWGLSYTGRFHHNNDAHPYSIRFGQGSVIGVHLDLWKGTLSFYKNKKLLGIASRGLTGKTLYPMASSTAACSGMRIIQSCSFPSSLQYLCCAKLRELIPDDKHVLQALDMPPGLKQFLSNNLNWLLDSRLIEDTSPPKKSGWKYALKPGSNDPIMSNVIDENEVEIIEPQSYDDNMLYISGRACMLQCGRNRQQARPRGNSARILGAGGSQDAWEIGALSNFGPEIDRTYETIGASDEEGVVERAIKRRRCSYNYAMGLSDSDSD